MFLILLFALAAVPYTEQATYGYQLGKGFYRRMFEGQAFCSTRDVGVQCCNNRDDKCTVSHERFRGTACYCDQFCDRAQPDCCPDYFDVCHIGPQRCNRNQFQCREQFQCIDVRSVCDRRFDCRDRSDEDGCSGGDTGKITPSLSPDVIHLSKYSAYRTEVEFTCTFQVENHDHQIRLEMDTIPPSSLKSLAASTSGTLTRNMTIRPNIEAIVCKGFDRFNDEKFALKSTVKQAQPEPFVGLPSPDYAKCVTVVNETPYSIVATVSYQDDNQRRQRQRTVHPSKQYNFKEVLHAEPGATYHTAVPVSTLKVTGVQSGFNQVEIPINVSGVHDCVTRRVQLDTSTGRLYITE